MIREICLSKLWFVFWFNRNYVATPKFRVKRRSSCKFEVALFLFTNSIDLAAFFNYIKETSF